MLVSLQRTLLTELLAFESGIDVRLHEWYCERFRTPSLEAPVVARAGRCVRHPDTGALMWQKVTVEEYFASLGVLRYFDRSRHESLREMQHRSMNALGFFGYQFGEAALRDLGVYRPPAINVPEIAEPVEQVYCGAVPLSNWAHGCQETLFWSADESRWILATDVNRWMGSFTGLYGITCFEDCFDEGKQRRIVIDLMCRNASFINERLVRRSVNPTEALRTRNADWSGVLAAAHLRGPTAVVDYLLSGVESADEFGTNIRRYLSRFSDLDISPLPLAIP